MNSSDKAAEGHEFTFTVEVRGEGCNWSSTMVPQTVRAYDLRAAIAELAKVPFPAWFPDEPDEVAIPPTTPVPIGVQDHVTNV